IRHVGKLEFLILANKFDDKENALDDPNGVDDAEHYLKSYDKDKLERMAKQGLPPPTPDKVYRIKLAHGMESKVGYSWVELSPKYRKEMQLSNRFEGQQNWNKAAEARARNGIAEIGNNFVYSRICKDQNLPEEVRKEKKYEYFLLTRNPEIDEKGE